MLFWISYASKREKVVPGSWDRPATTSARLVLKDCVRPVANAPAPAPSERMAGVSAMFGDDQTRKSLAPAAYSRWMLVVIDMSAALMIAAASAGPAAPPVA